MYHVTGIGITAVILYLISYLFCRLGLLTTAFHKKLWNILLAMAFLLAATGGIFLALQTSYKWDLPWVKTILKWHVEAGIALSFTGIFHFLWHLSYFSRLLKNQDVNSENTLSATPGQQVNGTAFTVTGFVSTSIQLILLREMLNIAGGYELISGIYLASWLITSAAGASLAGRSTMKDLRTLFIAFSASPLLSAAVMIILTRLFLNTGETPSFLAALIFTLLVLLPFCLVSAFTFIRLTIIAASEKYLTPGLAYSKETAGGVLAGLLVSILSQGLPGNFKLLLLTVILSAGYALLAFTTQDKRKVVAIKLSVLVLSVLVILTKPDLIFRQLLLPGIKVRSTIDTPYGNITHGEYNGEPSTYYNHRLLLFNNDVIEREENIHYAMLQGKQPGKVILIAGSFESQLPELLKYHINELTFIERDPELLKEYRVLADTDGLKIRMLATDAFRYIRKSHEKADVIISSVPPPSSFQLNRFYTTEFFRSVKERLAAGGYFVCSPGTGTDYLNHEAVALYSSVYKSLRTVFSEVLPVMGGKLYFIASDSTVSPDFCRLAAEKNISNLYVSSDYLSDDLTKRKSDELIQLMDSTARENRSALPLASYLYQDFGFSRDPGEKIPSIIVMILVFALPLFLSGRRNILMYFSASALAGFEIIILIMLQLTAGNMYQLTGLVLAALMAGLAAGSGSPGKIRPAVSASLLVAVYFSVSLFAGLITARLTSVSALALITALAFAPAFLTGLIYRDLTGAPGAGDAAGVYSADLAGSALGFLIVSGIAIPVLGIPSSVFLMGILILTGILLATISNKL